MAKKKDKTFKQKLWTSLIIIFALFIVGTMVAAMFGADAEEFGANTAIIRVIGPIMGDSAGGIFSEGVTGSSDVVDLLEKARLDNGIKAVIIEVNSPGGSAVASDEIGQAIKALDKPVVAWIREIGASGGYWVASSTDHIVANRMSITSSIGVYGSYLGFSEFIQEWNVTRERFVAGDRKDVGDPFRDISTSDRIYLQGKLDKIHEFFIEEIASNRNMSVEEVRPLADGSFMLGIEAYESGLVDELGGYDEAEAWVAEQIDEEVSAAYFEKSQGFFEGLFGVSKEPTSQEVITENLFLPLLR
ncbi:signal peptide peptidase SppA [Candidatus Woesearchaeota archaeon]|nr:signal peptide peptidase SppA [Candidatus Woesearchaeota archaeon]